MNIAYMSIDMSMKMNLSTHGHKHNQKKKDKLCTSRLHFTSLMSTMVTRSCHKNDLFKERNI